MDRVAERIARFLAGERARQTEFLAELVRMPSDNPPGDMAAPAEHAARLLERLGFTVDRHAVPEDRVRAVGMVSAVNLVVRHRFGPGPVIALNAHGDVVPPGDGWTQDPYGAAIVDGTMFGRGVAVSKSDFATYAFALLALRAVEAKLAGTVELHFTYDEESGGEIGPAWLLAEGISRPDYAIGAGFSYAVIDTHNGCLHLEVIVRGRSAHAAKPAGGIDALRAANAVLTDLYAARDGLASVVSRAPGIGSPQLTIGLIEGGINTNVVPDRVRLRLDRRVIPEEDPAVVEAELRALIERAVRVVPGVETEIRRILLAAPLVALPGAERLSAALCAAAGAVMGEAVGVGGVPLYTDARHYEAAGVPVVLYGAGPRSIEAANAHRADERLVLSDMFRATEVVARALCDLLG